MARYERLDHLLQLILLMQGRALGVSLADIMEEFRVGRRTAERMRDALIRSLPQIEERMEGRVKYWRLSAGSLPALADVTANELHAGHHALTILRQQGDPLQEDLASLLAKVRAWIPQRRRNKLEPDLEAQLLGDGVAFRPGPREQLNPDTLQALREAILKGVWIRADHRARASRKLSRNARLGPIAMLFGDGRQYLLAFSEHQEDLRLYALAGFERIEVTEDPYVRPENFNLEDWLHQSFGIWREEPFDVVWRFLPEVADEAANYVFHPRQTMERLSDGSLMVRFRAGGWKEMDWYLYRWGDKVEVLEPERLRRPARGADDRQEEDAQEPA